MKRNSDLLRTMMSTLLKKVLRKRKRKVVMEYFVKWKGYPDKHEKTRTASAVSTPESSIQFLMLKVQGIYVAQTGHYRGCRKVSQYKRKRRLAPVDRCHQNE